jgi:DUF1009 family protein
LISDREDTLAHADAAGLFVIGIDQAAVIDGPKE